VSGAANTTFAGTISGGGNLAKQGPGTLTLQGASSYSGTTAVNGGTLLLDFATQTSGILPETGVTLGGGALKLQGNAAAPTTQTVAGLTLTAGASAVRVTSGAGQSITLNLGPIFFGAGSAVDFSTVANGPGGSTTITTTGVNVNGILGGFATFGGSGWAAVSGGNVVALSAYDTNSFAANANTDLTAGQSPAGSPAISSLRFNTAGSPAALTVASGQTLTVNSGGVLVPNSVTAATAINGPGQLTSGNGTDLIVNQYNAAAKMTIGAAITGGIGLTKAGPGALELTAANGYSGPTLIHAGTLLANNPSGSATGSGAVTVGTGGTLGGGTSGGPGFADSTQGFLGTAGTPVSVTVNGTLAPGNSAGLLTVNGNVTFGSGATFAAEIGSANASTGADINTNDRLRTTGTLSFATGPGSVLNVAVDGQNLSFGQSSTYDYYLARADGGVGALSETVNITGSNFSGPVTFSLARDGTGKFLVLSFAPVPEPMTPLAVLAAGAIVLLRRRRSPTTCPNG
jgi:fibronectin-binding autotransporter adhesin